MPTVQSVSTLVTGPHRFYSLSQAKRRVRYWQKKFRLTDWTIHVSIVRAHQLDEHNQVILGNVGVLEVKQIAHIRLLNQFDFVEGTSYIDTHDHELTIIHELLHVRFDGMQDNIERVRYLSEERAVHALSEVFLSFDQQRGDNGCTAQRRRRSDDRRRLQRGKKRN